MLGEIIGLTLQVTQCDACLVYLIDRATGELVLRGSQVPHAADLGKLRMRFGEGVTGWVAEHKSPVALGHHAPWDARFKHIERLVEDTYQALLSVPVISGGEVIGIVNVHHREPHEHSPNEIGLVSFMGEQMGSALSKSLLDTSPRKKPTCVCETKAAGCNGRCGTWRKRLSLAKRWAGCNGPLFPQGEG